MKRVIYFVARIVIFLLTDLTVTGKQNIPAGGSFIVASNHLVALLGQVERIAAEVDVPLDALIGLARGSLDNVAALGPADALTGPASRGDDETIERHREQLRQRLPDELPAYDALVDLARRLAAG